MRKLPIILIGLVLVALIYSTARHRLDNKSALPTTSEDIVLFKDPGGRVDWSHQLNKIAFDKRGSDDFYDVYISNPDGTNESCLTCHNSSLDRHNGNPAFTPDGRFIVFQAQSKAGVLDNVLGTPGKGIYNNLWLTDNQGKEFWQLTDITSPGAFGVLHPHFSHDGRRLFWSQRVSGGNGAMGIWALKVADFQSNPPQLSNIKSYQPGKDPKFYESHGFSLDDSKIIYSGNPDGQTDKGFDIYTLDLVNEEVVNLTNSPDVWDEHARLSNDGSKIIWVSSQDNKLLKLDLWMMNLDGSNKKKILDLPDSIADSSFSPDGNKIVFYLIDNLKESNGKNYFLNLKYDK